MIPENIRNSFEDRTNFIDRLLIRKKAVDIVEIIYFFIPTVQGTHFGILESIWRNKIQQVERFLCLKKRHLVRIEIGDIGLRKPRSDLIHILQDCELFKRHQKQFQPKQLAIEQQLSKQERRKLEHRQRFLNRIVLRKRAILIMEILFFFPEYFFRVESFIYCSEWKEAIRLTEKALLKTKPELRNTSISTWGYREPKVKFVIYIHDCKEANC